MKDWKGVVMMKKILAVALESWPQDRIHPGYAAWKDNQNQKVRRLHTTANGQEKACPLPYL